MNHLPMVEQGAMLQDTIWDCHDFYLACRHAYLDEELKACAKLRAETFYTYPPERAFAGQVRVTARCDSRFL